MLTVVNPCVYTAMIDGDIRSVHANRLKRDVSSVAGVINFDTLPPDVLEELFQLLDDQMELDDPVLLDAMVEEEFLNEDWQLSQLPIEDIDPVALESLSRPQLYEDFVVDEGDDELYSSCVVVDKRLSSAPSCYVSF